MERRHMDELLEALKGELLRMSALAEQMITDASVALFERDPLRAEAVRKAEGQVNRLQVEIDERCLELIALHQPAAGDLRFILGAAKTNAELERLGDQAVNVMEKAERLMDQLPIKPFEDLPRMARLARQMLKQSLDAYVARDADAARRVLRQDDELDAMKRLITEELTSMMEKDPAVIRRALDLILIVRNFERIGDHATNIAENAIFVVEGRDVRHHLEPTEPPAAPPLAP